MLQGAVRDLFANSKSPPRFVLFAFSTSSVGTLWVYSCLGQFLFVFFFFLSWWSFLCSFSPQHLFISIASLSWIEVIFLKLVSMFFIIKGFRAIVFIVISTTFRTICPPVFFRCLSNSGTFTELRTTSFIESTGVTLLIPLAVTGYKYSCIVTHSVTVIGVGSLRF